MTSDRGLDAILPDYAPEYMSPADYAYWEVLYTDGTTLRETDGKTYADIDRSKVASFRIVHGGETLIETFPEGGATGHNLVYRRRTQYGGAGRRVIFLFGWAPMGPVFVLDPENASYRVAEGFDPTDQELSPPQPMPGEPEEMLDYMKLLSP